MKKPKRKASHLTGKSTNQEIIRWTKPHDVLDRLTKGVSEEVKDHSDLDEVLSRSDFPGQYRPLQKLHTSAPPSAGIRRACRSQRTISDA
jgi:hypothetical protein